jgi:hypothetical protein
MAAPNAGLRMLSVACLAAIVAAAPERDDFRAFAWSLALSHYAISLFYSRGRLGGLAAAGAGRAWLAGMALAIAALWQGQLSLVLYFGVHHVLNEVYMLDRVTERRDDPRVRRLRGWGLLLHGLLYAVILRYSLGLADLPWPALLTALAAGYGAYGLALLRARSVLSRRELAEHAVFELFALGVVAVSFVHPVGVLQVATYHFFYWVFYPAFSLARRGAGGVGRYAVTTVVVTGLLYLFSPAGFVEPHFSKDLYRELFVFFSYVHITLSFALSDANPRFLTERFALRRAAAPA